MAIEELETDETLLSSLVETITEDPIPNNVFTIEDTDNMVLLGKLNEVVASLEDIDATITASDTKANTALESASLALSTSNSASETATNAIETANTAIETANTAILSANTALENSIDALENSIDAVDIADTANTNASNAVITANSADTKADTAISTANSADSKADSAISTANSADTKADTAISTANSADSKADTAITTANTANSTANTANTNATNAVNTANSADAKADDAVATAEDALEQVVQGLGTKAYVNSVLQASLNFDSDPQTQIDDNETAISNEATARVTADTALQNQKVPNTRTVAGKALSADITLASTDLTDTANIARLTAPTNIAGTEQATAKFMTSNGGSLTIGKEGPNSGTMLRLDQVDGTPRLRFRSSATAGAMVWSQLEANAALYMDLADSAGVTKRITFNALQLSHPVKLYAPTVQTTTLTNGTYNYTLPSSTGTLALTSQIPELDQSESTSTTSAPSSNYLKTLMSNINTSFLNFNTELGWKEKVITKNLVTNGYIRYESGLIIQWGTYGRTSTATPTVTFPMTFPTACFLVVAGRTIDNTNRDTFAPAVKRDSTTRSQFTCFKQSATDRGFDWIALGY